MAWIGDFNRSLHVSYFAHHAAIKVLIKLYCDLECFYVLAFFSCQVGEESPIMGLHNGPPLSLRSDPAPDRPVCRSASPPGNGFKQYLQTRLYNSQGKGPTRNERTAFRGGRPPSREPHRSQSRAQELPPQPPPATPSVLSGPPSSSSSSGGGGGGGGGGGHHGHRRQDHLANGYDTDSSQESRDYSGHSSRSSRPWKPMREALNVDSVISSASSTSSGGGGGGGGSYPSRPDRRQPSPSRRRPNSHSPSRDRERDRDREQDRDRDGEPVAWGSREEHQPKSLMTIYEDEQRHEMGGSRSSLDSDSRGWAQGDDKARHAKGVPTALKLHHNDTWKIQRAESGYESSDRLSNGSANSPVVDSQPAKARKKRDRSERGASPAPTTGLPLAFGVSPAPPDVPAATARHTEKLPQDQLLQRIRQVS